MVRGRTYRTSRMLAVVMPTIVVLAACATRAPIADVGDGSPTTRCHGSPSTGFSSLTDVAEVGQVDRWAVGSCSDGSRTPSLIDHDAGTGCRVVSSPDQPGD